MIAANGQLYNKITSGEALTDEEVNVGARGFTDLGNQLWMCGPTFQLAARELLRVGRMCEEFRDARRQRR